MACRLAHGARQRIQSKAAHYAVGQFRTLDDAAASYFADPFLFVHQGSTHIFVEEVPNATGRGIISHFTLDARGMPSKPSAVLDTGSHLSYPQVFEHGGAIYMMPESSAAGGLDLYRATTFPLAWEKVGRLIEGRIHDATLFGHEGRLWIAAGSETLQSSSWDGLSLYYADRLEGPWSPHHLNPVLIDAAGARPAGPLWRDAQGSLVRPAQDCTRGYGGALTLKRILELSPARFREEPMGTVAFGEAGILGPHTIGRAGGFEVDRSLRPAGRSQGWLSRLKRAISAPGRTRPDSPRAGSPAASPPPAHRPRARSECRLSTVVVHLICNQGVAGSNPAAGTNNPTENWGEIALPCYP